MAMGEQWAYSRNEDGTYFGDFPDWRSAALDALHGYEDIRPGIWVGRCEPPVDPEHFIDANLILDHICCQDEYCGDWSDGWPGESQEQHDELTDAIRSVLAEWFDRHKLRPKFFTVPAPFFVTLSEAQDPAFDPMAPKGGVA